MKSHLNGNWDTFHGQKQTEAEKACNNFFTFSILREPGAHPGPLTLFTIFTVSLSFHLLFPILHTSITIFFPLTFCYGWDWVPQRYDGILTWPCKLDFIENRLKLK